MQAANMQTAEQTTQLLLCERFLTLVPPELKITLLEKHLPNVHQLALAADELWPFRKDDKQKAKPTLEAAKKSLEFKKAVKPVSQEVKRAPPSDVRKPATSGPPIFVWR